MFLFDGQLLAKQIHVQHPRRPQPMSAAHQGIDGPLRGLNKRKGFNSRVLIYLHEEESFIASGRTTDEYPEGESED